MAITRRSFRRSRSRQGRSRRVRSRRRASKSYMKRRHKTSKRMKGGDYEDDMFPLVQYSSYSEQKDAGDELLDYVYKYVVHCYLMSNQNPEVKDTRNEGYNFIPPGRTSADEVSEYTFSRTIKRIVVGNLENLFFGTLDLLTRNKKPWF